MTGIEPAVFEQYKNNPEEFILKSAQLINEQKATAIIEHITYHALDDHYGTEIFTEPTIKGKLNVNAMKAQKHLYDYIVIILVQGAAILQKSSVQCVYYSMSFRFFLFC